MPASADRRQVAWAASQARAPVFFPLRALASLVPVFSAEFTATAAAAAAAAAAAPDAAATGRQLPPSSVDSSTRPATGAKHRPRRVRARPSGR